MGNDKTLIILDAPTRGDKPGFVAGLQMEDETITGSDDVLEGMRGWSHRQVVEYAMNHGWNMHEV